MYELRIMCFFFRGDFECVRLCANFGRLSHWVRAFTCVLLDSLPAEQNSRGLLALSVGSAMHTLGVCYTIHVHSSYIQLLQIKSTQSQSLLHWLLKIPIHGNWRYFIKIDVDVDVADTNSSVHT